MNKALCDTLTGQFVTAAYLFFDTERGELRYSVAGHAPPILWRSGTRDQFELADSSGIFMGLEAQNAAGAFFGEGRLGEILARSDRLPAETFAGTLVENLQSSSGHDVDRRPFEDDLTIVVLDICSNLAMDTNVRPRSRFSAR